MLQNYFKFVGEKNENNITVKYKSCQGDNMTFTQSIWRLRTALQNCASDRAPEPRSAADHMNWTGNFDREGIDSSHFAIPLKKKPMHLHSHTLCA